jgi:hypothetical protein
MPDPSHKRSVYNKPLGSNLEHPLCSATNFCSGSTEDITGWRSERSTGRCAGSGNYRPAPTALDPDGLAFVSDYCFLMTPGVSPTVVVKGFQGLAAIKQRRSSRSIFEHVRCAAGCHVLRLAHSSHRHAVDHVSAAQTIAMQRTWLGPRFRAFRRGLDSNQPVN